MQYSENLAFKYVIDSNIAIEQGFVCAGVLFLLGTCFVINVIKCN